MKNLFMALLDVANRFGDITAAQMYNEKNSGVDFETGDKKVKIWVSVEEKENES